MPPLWHICCNFLTLKSLSYSNMYTSIVCDIKNSISIHNSHMVEEKPKSLIHYTKYHSLRAISLWSLNLKIAKYLASYFSLTWKLDFHIVLPVISPFLDTLTVKDGFINKTFFVSGIRQQCKYCHYFLLLDFSFTLEKRLFINFYHQNNYFFH